MLSPALLFWRRRLSASPLTGILPATDDTREHVLSPPSCCGSLVRKLLSAPGWRTSISIRTRAALFVTHLLEAGAGVRPWRRCSCCPSSPLQNREERWHEGNGHAGDGGQAQQPVFDLSEELSISRFISARSAQADMGNVADRNSGNARTRSVGIHGERGCAHQVGCDDVAPQQRLVAVTERIEEISIGHEQSSESKGEEIVRRVCHPQKQIPCGNDNKKDVGRSHSVAHSTSLLAASLWLSFPKGICFPQPSRASVLEAYNEGICSRRYTR